jgi:endo-1,4-beta-D-glucanase Y
LDQSGCFGFPIGGSMMRLINVCPQIVGMTAVLTLASCSGSKATVPDPSTGGSLPTGNGGTSAVGSTDAGGTSNTTSSSAAGGSSSTGGISSSSTTQAGTSTGGTKASGGTSSTTATGGKTGAGGTSTGGTKPTGGTSSGTQPAAGGSSSAVGGASTGGASTGTVATGGATAGGTSAATGGNGIGGQTTTPPSATAKFPFPQNRRDTKCIYPTNADYGDVQKVYDQWKQHLITSDGVGSNCSSCRRVKRPKDNGLQTDSTVSEGIAYGMIIAVYMNDQPLFDDLWRYEQAHTWTYTASYPATGSSPTSLMNWYIAADGTVATTGNGGMSGTGAATDADEDMAWALIMADKQWGGKGSLSDTYANNAKKLLGDIWKYEIYNNKTPKNGGSWGSDDCLNISYFAPSEYRAFASYSGENRWVSDVVPNIYTIIAASLNSSNGNQNNGLVPAFSTSTGANDKCGTNGASNQKHWYQYDSCRTPFRIGVDACLNDSAEAKAYVAKTSSFFAPKGVAGIVDGYELDGKDKAEVPLKDYGGLSAAFIGPAGVGAMVPQSGKDYQAFLDDVYSHLRQNNMWTGGQYYEESWALMSLLMMTGNYLDFTKY